MFTIAPKSKHPKCPSKVKGINTQWPMGMLDTRPKRVSYGVYNIGRAHSHDVRERSQAQNYRKIPFPENSKASRLGLWL